MYTEFFLNKFSNKLEDIAIVWQDKRIKYKDLIKKYHYIKKWLVNKKVSNNDIIGVSSDFSPNTIALLLCLINMRCIIIPLPHKNDLLLNKKIKIAGINKIIDVDYEDTLSIKNLNKIEEKNPLYKHLIDLNAAGLVLFSSGTSGEPKAAVHNFFKLLDKYFEPRQAKITLNFLLFDHWGGLNTMFHIFANLGTLVVTDDRSTDRVCELIDDYQVEVLPSSPSFLNLLLVSGAYKRYKLESLKTISYGTEPMPQYLLEKLGKIFPNVRLLQTYGLIELGVMKSKSENNSSLWLKIIDKNYKTRIRDGTLQIKTNSAMLGYLNAPSPFTCDGWFDTKDKVIKKNGFIKILGRKSEIINVGGEKVYPQEVENEILKMPNIADVTVFSEKNLILGEIVCAKLKLIKNNEKSTVFKELKNFLRKKLESFKIPIKIEIEHKDQFGSRFKKQR